MLLPHEIDMRFNHLPPNTDEVVSQHQAVRQEIRRLAHALNELLPASRETSMVFSRLEEASYWAHASVARYGYVHTLPS